ncbi:MAG: glycoside hydrolase family 9 protein [Spirochaetaceae bacterium]
MRILTNHVGYDSHAAKRAVVQVPGARGPNGDLRDAEVTFELRREDDGTTAASGTCAWVGPVDRWSCGEFLTLEFTDVRTPGRYRLEVRSANAPPALSEPFEIAPRLIYRETFWNLLCHFKGQRSGGDEDEHDRAAAFHGNRDDRADVHGGWFDASGDTSKYLSHLSYANYLNPQQTPAAVWAMLAAREVLPAVGESGPALAERRLREEAAWGADFLVRMQDPAGYFYVTVFDRWSKELEDRIISSFRTQEGHRGADYQAGLRQGGGMAVAALARAAAAGVAGEFGPVRYLHAARRGFAHLEGHNLEYLDDGAENIIDDYCGLLAATELYAATGEAGYLEAARGRCEALGTRFGTPEAGTEVAETVPTGTEVVPHWYGAEVGGRPYYHAAEAGLPVMALLRFAEVGADADARTARSPALRALDAELAVTAGVSNPFGYARQWVQSVAPGAGAAGPRPTGPERAAFFIPHENETGYWWQGENARLASLAAAALWAAAVEPPTGAVNAAALRSYARDQMNWVLGLNPFDTCMMDGVGRNNPEYMPEFPNAPGGICNGITGGVDDEHDIAFLPEPHASSPLHRWRWSEQWIPHAAWFLLAAAYSAVVPEGDV